MIDAEFLNKLRADPPRLVRYLRVELLSVSLEELARQLGCAEGTVWKWEHAQTRPHPRNWRRVLALLDRAVEQENERQRRFKGERVG